MAGIPKEFPKSCGSYYSTLELWAQGEISRKLSLTPGEQRSTQYAIRAYYVFWWLPLSDAVRETTDLETFHEFLLRQEHKPYDVPQAIKSGLDELDDDPLLGRVTYGVEDFSRFFCSELVAAALEDSGAITHLNASEVTPIDLCKFAIYRRDYYHLRGEGEPIQGYNTLSPEGWGE